MGELLEDENWRDVRTEPRRCGPHHDPFIHAQIVASTPAGLMVESFPDPSRDPLQAELFHNPLTHNDGMLILNQDPGLGLTLSPDAIKVR